LSKKLHTDPLFEGLVNTPLSLNLRYRFFTLFLL
jgi:hypothetical protein